LTYNRRRADNLGVLRAAVLCLIVAGCHPGGSQPPSCGAVAAKFLELAKSDLTASKVDEATSRQVTDQLPAMRDALAQACTEGKWSETIRSCLVRANDHVGFETCEQQLTDEQRRDLGRGVGAPSAPATEAPSPSHPGAPHGNLDPAH